jgi:hypothetical protein
MTGRETLREIRDALAAARAGEWVPPSAPPVAEELEALARSLEKSGGQPPVPPTSVRAETPAEDA